jgi:hypothetical protein
LGLSLRGSTPRQRRALHASRDQTRREYLVELQQRFGFQPLTQQLYRRFIHELDALADQTYQGIALA